MANFGNKGGRKPSASKGNALDLPAQFEITNSRCKVCTCTQRREVDMMLSTGWSQRAVVRWLNEIHGADAFSPKNMSTHARNHLSLKDATVRKIIETRAKQAGLDVNTATDFILTRQGVAESIVQTGLQYLLKGVVIPETKDMLSAMQYLDQLDESGRDIAVDEMLFEFNTFANAVKWVLEKYLGEEKANDWYTEIYEEFERRLDERKPKALTSESEVTDEVIEDGEYEETD